ncbi:uncharacterized protein LOC108115322 [Drosophila eugracilis]|uniref:uncharacterized protein LOC108115322 n=1 Tax=Drosophila eugracilis TaxID=29029 RepID=UPI0007E8403F|nr:uncharacterized protein LOC108115322 [Drosophila eugracilis]
MDPVQREKELIKMEMPRHRKLVSTNRADYVDHTGSSVYNPPIRKTQEDPSLITGHYCANLKIAGIENKTMSWPRSMDWREDYAQFIKRNRWCNEEIYNLFFRYPPVDFNVLKNYIRDLRKSVYMYDYSRKSFISLKSRGRIGKIKDFTDMGKDYQTTYGCYYNRLQEAEAFKPFLYPERDLKDLTLDMIAKDLRRLFIKYNITTYFDTICVPALMKAKNGVMPSSPIDKYQFRKY